MAPVGDAVASLAEAVERLASPVEMVPLLVMTATLPGPDAVTVCVGRSQRQTASPTTTATAAIQKYGAGPLMSRSSQRMVKTPLPLCFYVVLRFFFAAKPSSLYRFNVSDEDI